MKFCILKFYEVKSSEFPNSKTTLWSKTFDFTYWGTFSARNSEVFVQTELVEIFKTPPFFRNALLKKIFNNQFSACRAKSGDAIKLFWFVLTHHFVYCPKKFFLNNLKIWLKILWSGTFLKNQNFEKSFASWNVGVEVFLTVIAWESVRILTHAEIFFLAIKV